MQIKLRSVFLFYKKTLLLFQIT